MYRHHPPPELEQLQVYGGACVASGIPRRGSPVLVTLLYSPAVPSEQWSYPFTTSTQWVVSIGLAATHALTALGFLGHPESTAVRRQPRGDAMTLQLAVTGFGPSSSPSC